MSQRPKRTMRAESPDRRNDSDAGSALRLSHPTLLTSTYYGRMTVCRALRLKSGYVDCVQILILIPPLPPWVNHSFSNCHFRN